MHSGSDVSESTITLEPLKKGLRHEQINLVIHVDHRTASIDHPATINAEKRMRSSRVHLKQR